MKKPFHIRLHILSPVHIGCDDVYEPTGFVIDEKKNELIEFDPFLLVRSLTPGDRDEFGRICMQDNLLAIFKFVKRAYRPNVGGRVADIVPGLAAHYVKSIINQSTYDRMAVINRFTLSKTAYNPHNNLPYIPGSSIKGSLRTAWLNDLSRKAKLPKYRGKGSDLEKELLGGAFERDPFRLVKVSDLIPEGSVKTRIVYGINRKKKPGLREAGGPTQIFEVLREGSVFTGKLNVEAPEKGSDIKNPIALNALLSACNQFYEPLLHEEKEIYDSISASHCAARTLGTQYKSQLGKSACILRIGRHSGAEAVTIDGHRNIKIMQGRNNSPKWFDHSTTIWLSSQYSKPRSNDDLLPFGWALLEAQEMEVG